MRRKQGQAGNEALLGSLLFLPLLLGPFSDRLDERRIACVIEQKPLLRSSQEAAHAEPTFIMATDSSVPAALSLACVSAGRTAKATRCMPHASTGSAS